MRGRRGERKRGREPTLCTTLGGSRCDGGTGITTVKSVLLQSLSQET